MKQATLSIPEVGILAATRGMAGAGVALLLGDRLSPERRRALGWQLLAIGVFSTIPLLIDIVSKTRSECNEC